MVGLGMAELILLAMMTGAGAPAQLAFGNPMIWLAQSVLTRSIPGGALAGMWLLAEAPMPPPAVPQLPPPGKMAPPAKTP